MSVSVVDAKLWNELASNLRDTKNILLFRFFLEMGCRAYYSRTYHMIGYICVEKSCSTLNIVAEFLSLMC